MNRVIIFVLILVCSAPTWALDDDHLTKAKQCINKGVLYLRASQNDDGSWFAQPGPAVTAMVLQAMIQQSGSDVSKDPAMQKALAYIMNSRHDNGAIHRGALTNYNTAICLSTLARITGRDDMDQTITQAQQYLIGLQWQGQKDPANLPVDKNHPYYGGAGYGRHGRPDLSNTQIMLQGLHDSGLSSDDPAFVRALVFISRCQGTEANDMFAARIKNDGGFIYATSIDKNHIGEPQSMAGEDAVQINTVPVSQLRTYGSMTYAGFKSYLYANIKRNDPRVIDAHNWIRTHYTLTHNPGMPDELKHHGYYYYLITFSRALSAWGDTHIQTPDSVKHDWANDLIDTLANLQRKDGSWTNPADRWMEGNADLVTAYGLLALQQAIK
jgi:squalene-hopene/tetraprenyl-beta-curcumene cyclase